MSEMVERVARAIKEREDEWLRREGDALGALAAENIEPLYHAMAHAAIKAMREPTPDVQRAGFKGLDPHGECNCDQLDCWHEMIDAALAKPAA